jgi:CBS domain-containing protein
MSKLKVRDLMTTQVVTLQPTDTIKKATIKFAVDNISGAPVVDGRNHLLGIVSENDILQLIYSRQIMLDKENTGAVMLSYSMDSDENGADGLQRISDEISNMEVGSIMVRTVLTTSPDAPVMEVLKSMIEMGVNRLPVVEKGVVIGVISRADIVFALYKKKV